MEAKQNRERMKDLKAHSPLLERKKCQMSKNTDLD